MTYQFTSQLLDLVKQREQLVQRANSPNGEFLNSMNGLKIIDERLVNLKNECRIADISVRYGFIQGVIRAEAEIVPFIIQLSKKVNNKHREKFLNILSKINIHINYALRVIVGRNKGETQFRIVRAVENRDFELGELLAKSKFFQEWERHVIRSLMHDAKNRRHDRIDFVLRSLDLMKTLFREGVITPVIVYPQEAYDLERGIPIGEIIQVFVPSCGIANEEWTADFMIIKEEGGKYKRENNRQRQLMPDESENYMVFNIPTAFLYDVGEKVHIKVFLTQNKNNAKVETPLFVLYYKHALAISKPVIFQDGRAIMYESDFKRSLSFTCKITSGQEPFHWEAFVEPAGRLTEMLPAEFKNAHMKPLRYPDSENELYVKEDIGTPIEIEVEPATIVKSFPIVQEFNIRFHAISAKNNAEGSSFTTFKIVNIPDEVFGVEEIAAPTPEGILKVRVKDISRSSSRLISSKVRELKLGAGYTDYGSVDSIKLSNAIMSYTDFIVNMAINGNALNYDLMARKSEEISKLLCQYRYLTKSMAKSLNQIYQLIYEFLTKIYGLVFEYIERYVTSNPKLRPAGYKDYRVARLMPNPLYFRLLANSSKIPPAQAPLNTKVIKENHNIEDKFAQNAIVRIYRFGFILQFPNGRRMGYGADYAINDKNSPRILGKIAPLPKSLIGDLEKEMREWKAVISFGKANIKKSKRNKPVVSIIERKIEEGIGILEDLDEVHSIAGITDVLKIRKAAKKAAKKRKKSSLNEHLKWRNLELNPADLAQFIAKQIECSRFHRKSADDMINGIETAGLVRKAAQNPLEVEQDEWARVIKSLQQQLKNTRNASSRNELQKRLDEAAAYSLSLGRAQAASETKEPSEVRKIAGEAEKGEAIPNFKGFWSALRSNPGYVMELIKNMLKGSRARRYLFVSSLVATAGIGGRLELGAAIDNILIPDEYPQENVLSAQKSRLKEQTEVKSSKLSQKQVAVIQKKANEHIEGANLREDGILDGRTLRVLEAFGDFLAERRYALQAGLVYGKEKYYDTEIGRVKPRYNLFRVSSNIDKIANLEYADGIVKVKKGMVDYYKNQFSADSVKELQQAMASIPGVKVRTDGMLDMKTMVVADAFLEFYEKKGVIRTRTGSHNTLTKDILALNIITLADLIKKSHNLQYAVNYDNVMEVGDGFSSNIQIALREPGTPRVEVASLLGGNAEQL